jgi:hypothetical protein
VKYLWLVHVAGKDEEEGEVECVIEQAKCYGAKNEDLQMVTLTDAVGKEYVELYNKLNWEASVNELKKSVKEKTQDSNI